MTTSEAKLSFEEGVATLEVTSATEEDTGVYTCEATNEEGTTLHSAEVFVTGKTCNRILVTL